MGLLNKEALAKLGVKRLGAIVPALRMNMYRFLGVLE